MITEKTELAEGGYELTTYLDNEFRVVTEVTGLKSRSTKYCTVVLDDFYCVLSTHYSTGLREAKTTHKEVAAKWSQR